MGELLGGVVGIWIVSRLLRFPIATGLACSLAFVGGAAAELTEEELRSQGATEDLIEFFRQLKEYEEHGMPSRPQYPASYYLDGGSSKARELMSAVAHRENGLELAREVLLRTKLREPWWPDSAVLHGLLKRTSPEVLDLLDEAAALHGPFDFLWESIRTSWADTFRRLHGDDSFELAKQAVADPFLPSEQRALHLLVFGFAIFEKERLPMALEVYRPYLHTNVPNLQRAAALLAWKFWDYDVRAQIEQVGWSSTDPKARGLAHTLWGAFLRVGPDKTKGTEQDMHITYDPGGLMAYFERLPEWKREQRRLMGGQDPPPPAERPPASDRRPRPLFPTE